MIDLGAAEKWTESHLKAEMLLNFKQELPCRDAGEQCQNCFSQKIQSIPTPLWHEIPHLLYFGNSFKLLEGKPSRRKEGREGEWEAGRMDGRERRRERGREDGKEEKKGGEEEGKREKESL